MDTRLFSKIAQLLKEQFSKALYELLMEQACQIYEVGRQQRAKLSPSKKAKAEARKIMISHCN